MKACHPFLVGFAIIAWFFLSGLALLPDNEVDTSYKQGVASSLIPNLEVSAEQSQEEKKINENAVKVRPKKKARTKGVSQQQSFIRSEPDHPLDLSIPFKATTEKLDVNKKWLIPHQALDVFAFDPNKKARSLELNGDLLMSPDPQPEKRKSVDGAGIVINIKP